MGEWAGEETKEKKEWSTSVADERAGEYGWTRFVFSSLAIDRVYMFEQMWVLVADASRFVCLSKLADAKVCVRVLV
jgi:hypothetical protein